MFDGIIDKLLDGMFRPLVRQGLLEVVTPAGRTHSFGDGGTPQARIRFADRRAVAALVADPDLKFGEMFMNERVVVEKGTIYDVLELVLRGAKGVEVGTTVKVLDAIRHRLRPILQANERAKSKANVAHHYDLDGGLYDLFLDKDRQYSCAYFERGDETLDEAQLAKKRHIVSKLLVEPGHKVLDIGCGWGGMSRYIAEVAQAGDVTGITLSENQIAIAKNLGAASPRADSLHYRLEDYRDTKGPFDRIVSVGMFEHVGTVNHDPFFRQVKNLLTEDGVMLLHFIGNFEPPAFNNPWIEKYIFPGGHLPSMSEFTPAVERAGLIITDIEVLRLHYATTLRMWRDRFLARRDEAAKLYDERFVRMWEYFLSMSETAFRYEDIAIFQVQITRRQEAVPLTRDYIAPAKAKLLAREKELGL